MLDRRVMLMINGQVDVIERTAYGFFRNLK